MKQLSVATGENKELTLPEGSSVNLFATVIPTRQPSGNDYEFEWSLLPSSRFDNDENQAEMAGKHSQKLQLTKVWQVQSQWFWEHVWSSGIVLDSRSLDREFEPHWLQRVYVFGQDT